MRRHAALGLGNSSLPPAVHAFEASAGGGARPGRRRESNGRRKTLIALEIPHLRRFAIALTRDKERADDLVQDTLERALRKHTSWRRSGSLRGWLFKLLYRVYLNGEARRRMELEHADAIASSDESAQPLGQKSHVEILNIAAALDRLPLGQRETVLLVALEGLTYDEVAYVTGVPVGTVKSRLFRGRAALLAMRHGKHAHKQRRRQ